MSKKQKERKLRQWRKKSAIAALSSEAKSTAGEADDLALYKNVDPPVKTSVRLGFLVLPALLLGLMLLLNFRPIMQNDFWMHLKIGEDILETLEVPRIDHYSAVAAGRPFIAHEWLAGVFLALVGGVFGPLGFTGLGELVAASIAVLLFFSLPKAQRESPIIVPFGIVAAYLMAFRLVIRPDLFTMLFLAVWAFAIERWRASREIYWLTPLVPLITLWANFHGAFVFGVALLCMLALLTAMVKWGHGLQQTGEGAYSISDLRHVVMVAGLGVVACLLNPHGWNLPWFSVQMATGEAFEQVRAVTEWQPTFDTDAYFFQNFPYIVYAFGAWLLLLWCGLVLRIAERPLFDFTIAAVVTYLSMRQNRFIPYAAAFGFPIAIRSWHAVLERFGGSAYTDLMRQRWVKAAGVLLLIGLIGLTFKRGYILNSHTSAALGWGYGSRHPQAEAAYLKENAISGVLYNERMPDGAYLIRELFPAVQPVMDMRLDVYGKQLCDEYDATKSSRQLLTDYVHKYNVNLALVSTGGWIDDHFRRALGYAVAFSGSERTVLIKRW